MINLLVKFSCQRLIFPFYHTVSNEELPHIKHLYKVKNEKEFDMDLDFLIKHYEPISYQDLQNHVNGARSIKKNSFLLTFDDGLSEIYHIISPILIKKGIPAVYFLNSAFIDNKSLFYRYKESLLIEKYLKLPSSQKKAVESFLHLPYCESSEIIQKIKSFDYSKRETLNPLATMMNLDFEEFLLEKKPYLTSEQIKTLVNQGFSFGGHSVDHPEYRLISEQEQLLQTKKSIDYVQQNFELSYRTFSFPFTDAGVTNHFFEETYKNKVAEITFGTAGLKKEIFKNHFHRIPAENSFTLEKTLWLQYLYYFIKMPFNKNTIFRSHGTP